MSVNPKSRIHFVGAVLCAFSIGACGTGRGIDSTRPALQPLPRVTGAAVLEKAAQKYASASCYEDTGTAKLFERGRSIDGECEFRFWTSFRRNDYLRFSFRKDCSAQAGFEHAKGVTKIWYEENEHRKEIEDRSNDSLQGAVERFAGTSNGVSRMVPMLLFGHDAFRLRGASTHVLETKVNVCGYDECYSVLVQDDPETRVLYVVDRDFVLRSIEERRWRADGDSAALISIYASCVMDH
jgi:hypothetical protein